MKFDRGRAAAVTVERGYGTGTARAMRGWPETGLRSSPWRRDVRLPPRRSSSRKRDDLGVALTEVCDGHGLVGGLHVDRGRTRAHSQRAVPRRRCRTVASSWFFCPTLRHDTLRPPIALGQRKGKSFVATCDGLCSSARVLARPVRVLGLEKAGGWLYIPDGAGRIARIQVLRSDGSRGGPVVAPVDVSVPNAVRGGTVHAAMAGTGEQIAVSRRLGRGNPRIEQSG
jgi:hypothetical protein